MTAAAIRLVTPSAALLDGYAAALRAGWSPNTMRDVSADELEAVEADGAAFLDDLNQNRGVIKLPDGREVPRLPAQVFWISDGDFCGVIGLRYQDGSDELPPYVPGHIGYSVVPWKQGRGYATAALGALLPVAREAGLRVVTISCDSGNAASQKVVLSNGGVLAQVLPDAEKRNVKKLVFRIGL